MSPVVAGRRPNTDRSHVVVQLRSAPALEPPFDDESSPRSFGVPGAQQLTLALSATQPQPAQPHGSPGYPGSGGPGGRAGPGTTARRPGPAAESWQAARRFMAICLEILNGYRPTGHIRPVTSPAHALAVVEQLSVARERAAALVRKDPRTERAANRTRRPGPPRGQPHRRDAAVRLRVLRVCEPRAGIAEAAAVLHTGGRTWAMAVRLERRRGRWLCTAARTL